jgi:hypothetical protein
MAAGSHGHKKAGIAPCLITTPFMALAASLERAPARPANPPLFHCITHHEGPLLQGASRSEVP